MRSDAPELPPAAGSVPAAAGAPPAGPLPAAQRIATLDVVRGVALLGIFVMNMPGFSMSFYAGADGSPLWPGPLDRAAEHLREWLFSGKFNSLFGLLFGVGFTIQLRRLTAAAGRRGGTAIYARRLFALLGFGLLHALVFWTGDVLHVYAVLGFVLLLLRGAPDRVLVALVVATLLYQPLSGVLRLWLMSPEAAGAQLDDAQAWVASNNLAYGAGSFVDAAREHAREWLYYYADPWSAFNLFGFYVQMLTAMLVGVLLGRHDAPRHLAAMPPALLPRLRRWQWASLAVGIVCTLVFAIVGEFVRAPGPSPWKLLVGMCYVLSRLAMMGFYALTIARLAQRPAWQRRFAPLAAAGRMPLTHYLLQTAIGTTLFYGWGFGLGFDNPGRLGPAAQLLLAPAIFFGVQLPLSVWWLRRFERGPLEALWRWLTYGPAARTAASLEKKAP